MKVKEVIKNFFLIIKNLSRNFSAAVVGSEGSYQRQKIPCSDLYLFSRSIGAPQMFPVLNAGF